MANVNNLNSIITKGENQNQLQEQQKPNTVKAIFNDVKLGNAYKKKFEEILGRNASAFMTSIVTISNQPQLAQCNPNTIIGAAVTAATLNLMVNSNVGHCYVLPYKDRQKGMVANFQLGYKGYIQLAIRSGQFETINAEKVHKGEIKKFNRITGKLEIDEDFEPTEDSEVIGYVGYFKLLNGFEKYFYMTLKALKDHANQYSQSYKSQKQWVKDSSLWNTNFDAMARKTVLKLLLSKYAPLSIEMQDAIKYDSSVINMNENTEDIPEPDYIDNGIEVEFETITE